MEIVRVGDRRPGDIDLSYTFPMLVLAIRPSLVHREYVDVVLLDFDRVYHNKVYNLSVEVIVGRWE